MTIARDQRVTNVAIPPSKQTSFSQCGILETVPREHRRTLLARGRDCFAVTVDTFDIDDVFDAVIDHAAVTVNDANRARSASVEKLDLCASFVLSCDAWHVSPLRSSAWRNAARVILAGQ